MRVFLCASIGCFLPPSFSVNLFGHFLSLGIQKPTRIYNREIETMTSELVAFKFGFSDAVGTIVAPSTLTRLVGALES